MMQSLCKRGNRPHTLCQHQLPPSYSYDKLRAERSPQHGTQGKGKGRMIKRNE